MEDYQDNFYVQVDFKKENSFYGFGLYLDTKEFTQALIHNYLSHNEFYERDASLFLIKFLNEGDTFIDVGSHIGYFSFFAASIVGNSGKVYSFEPQIDNFNKLNFHKDRNKFTNLITINKALSDSEEIRDFYINLDNDGGHSFWDIKEFPVCEKTRENPIVEKLETTTLDNWFKDKKLKNLSFIKIDVEGAEFMVLQGAENILREFSPFIICELSELALSKLGSSQREMRKFMFDLGYKTFIFDQKTLVHVPDDKMIVSEYVINILFARPENLKL